VGKDGFREATISIGSMVRAIPERHFIGEVGKS